MFEKIDINNFGNFSNFVWKNEVVDNKNNTQFFKKLNIIYGRNYSGKTTLSRIFRAIEQKKLHDRYPDQKFTIKTKDGNINQDSLLESTQNVRVYNKDFVDENLSFLRDEDGEISSFAVFGDENKIIQSKIDALEKLLGSVDEKNGIRYEFHFQREILRENEKKLDNLKIDLDKKLFNKANSKNGIKHNLLYKQVNYDTRRLQNDIDIVLENKIQPMSEEERSEKISLINQEILPDITHNIFFIADLSAFKSKTEALITKKITTTSPINDLLNDELLQNWVRTGLPLHEGKRSSCGFCGNHISDDLFKRINQHFNQESKDLEQKIDDYITLLNTELIAIQSIELPNITSFYPSLQKEYENTSTLFLREIKNYAYNLDLLISLLKRRKDNIFTELKKIEINDNSGLVNEIVSKLHLFFKRHKEITKSLSGDRDDILKALRLSEVSDFIEKINYKEKVDEIEEFKTLVEKTEREVNKIRSDGTEKSREIEILKSKLRDERRGAEKVNEYLGQSLSGKKLKLVPVEDFVNKKFTFKITRNDDDAFNLSEGECSLISFCYFLAKLEDIETKGKEVCIYIDDPISSLDSNHIFFIFSLIENYIAKPATSAAIAGGQIYNQIFISTHNLEFLKYLKRLSRQKNQHEHFLIFNKGTGSSICLMPDNLRNYVTELNYLFGEIYNCSKSENYQNYHHSFYNFGNNLRKFLEAFLFFKYPSTEGISFDRRIELFFYDGTSTEALLKRLINEYSHLGEFVDRSAQPVDAAETSGLAQLVLKKIKDNDRDQFAHFLLSIDKTDPFVE